ncbi:hypothetical protein K504DRAFT_49235 [Pleomassaria siparia CBS 279.74]|uniref:Uncharacterized protein n=1 Tax=Pleomassaria siparia CBS 279.74 TaxID=1314801 RepID=A0A6G1K3N6_9PLEO|nr:hypothetical protein K504DRAFT_49235 [Pleomassaria siparia CBS 279.74]
MPPSCPWSPSCSSATPIINHPLNVALMEEKHLSFCDEIAWNVDFATLTPLARDILTEMDFELRDTHRSLLKDLYTGPEVIPSLGDIKSFWDDPSWASYEGGYEGLDRDGLDADLFARMRETRRRFVEEKMKNTEKEKEKEKEKQKERVQTETSLRKRGLSVVKEEGDDDDDDAVKRVREQGVSGNEEESERELSSSYLTVSTRTARSARTSDTRSRSTHGLLEILRSTTPSTQFARSPSVNETPRQQTPTVTRGKAKNKSPWWHRKLKNKDKRVDEAINTMNHWYGNPPDLVSSEKRAKEEGRYSPRAGLYEQEQREQAAGVNTERYLNYLAPPNEFSDPNRHSREYRNNVRKTRLTGN